MSNEDRRDEVQPAQPASTALVPVSRRIERRSRRRWYRWAPDPIFIAHLIAEAEQVPQARTLRRASPADAQAVYRTREIPAPGAGGRVRQLI